MSEKLKLLFLPLFKPYITPIQQFDRQFEKVEVYCLI